MLKQVVKPLSYHKPPEKICEELKKGDAQICELQYGKCRDSCVQFSSGQILVEFFFNKCMFVKPQARSKSLQMCGVDNQVFGFDSIT